MLAAFMLSLPLVSYLLNSRLPWSEPHGKDDFARPEPKKQGKPPRGPGKGKEKKPCLCCDEPVTSGSKYCMLHKRSAQAMQHQADAQGKEAGDFVRELLSTDATARDEVSHVFD